jgi:hypothetical protein
MMHDKYLGAVYKAPESIEGVEPYAFLAEQVRVLR